jgi:peptidoglycan L-alanyl-D-glutamate endopeptidase CwlK
MSAKISDLIPSVADAATKAIQDMLDRHVPHAVTSTLRTLAEQEALFAQHRRPLSDVNSLRLIAGMKPITDAENSYIVTNADGVIYKSNHQSGRAIDIVPVDRDDNPIWPPVTDVRWQMIAVVMKQHGFAWGGDWTGGLIDLPHYEA